MTENNNIPAPERSKEETGVRIKPLEWPDASITNHEAMRAVLEGAVAPAILSIALPDELEVAKLIGQLRSRPGEAITRVERLMDEAADALSQAHSTIAALRAKLREVVEEREAWLGASIRQQKRARTAEAEVKRLTEEKEGLRDLAERLKLEAQGHASEAKTANSTIYEIYQVLSGGKGEPGNWHGAEPARRYVEAAEARIKALEEALRPFAALGEEAAWMTKPDDAGAWGFDDAHLTWGDSVAPAPPSTAGRRQMHPANEPRNLLRRVNRARNFPVNTCPASRHVQMIGEALIKGRKHSMIDEEPEHVGGSLLSVVESLYKARTEIARLRQDILRSKE